MKAEEFAHTSEGELRERANECFARAETAGTLDKPGLLIEARFYIDEIERREHAKTSRRDFSLEITVLVLEVIVVVLIGMELYGGYDQLDELKKLDGSVGETAKILGSLRDSQQAALKAQKESLDTIEAMNTALQKQMALTGKMSESLKGQLAILVDEQSRRLPRPAKQAGGPDLRGEIVWVVCDADKN